MSKDWSLFDLYHNLDTLTIREELSYKNQQFPTYQKKFNFYQIH